MKERTPKIIGATEWWQCCVCNDWKLSSSYGKHSGRLSGLHGRCKDCDKDADTGAQAAAIKREKQKRIPLDMAGKRLALMNTHRAGNDTSLSYDDLSDNNDNRNGGSNPPVSIKETK